ncbi:hypothetical protein M407DRAFT_28600 [Tulasnella calospora MUT 4182]|uniref:Uncharacterized protein n=1 Tax=Tulasnella calospora MUT 4182 TaxID=1051891 RepID=A0A0C3LKJ7_9AGAM|nr:hypothetical protein M407DRAFT_28600 [Tulasnella calospora MUT 4182]
MSSPTGVDSSEAQAKSIAEKAQYRQVLRRRRTRIITLKLLVNILFLFAWTFVTLSNNTYPIENTLLGFLAFR